MKYIKLNTTFCLRERILVVCVCLHWKIFFRKKRRGTLFLLLLLLLVDVFGHGTLNREPPVMGAHTRRRTRGRRGASVLSGVASPFSFPSPTPPPSP
jgi:hypothetical protein